MPKNQRTTITQNWETFYDCITKNLPKNTEEIKKVSDKLKANEEIDWNNRSERLAAQYSMLYMLKEYGLEIKKAERENKTLDLDKMYNTVSKLEASYLLPTSEPDIKWSLSDSFVSAMNKFAGMIFKNEKRQLEYARKLQAESPGLTFSRQELAQLQTPTEPEETREWDRVNELSDIHILQERLKKADDNMHINSASFRTMKKALNNLEKLMRDGVTTDRIAKGVEELQNASMKYIDEKGVGKQKTSLGKERMDLALDICTRTSIMMDAISTYDRMKEVREQEKTKVGHIVSREETAVIDEIEENEQDREYEEYKNDYGDVNDIMLDDSIDDMEDDLEFS